MAKGPSIHTTAGIERARQVRQQQRDRQHNARAMKRLYNSRAWRRFRLGFLREHPLCADCEAKDVLTPASEVHHVRGLAAHPEDLCDGERCSALCRSCHSVRTAAGE